MKQVIFILSLIVATVFIFCEQKPCPEPEPPDPCVCECIANFEIIDTFPKEGWTVRRVAMYQKDSTYWTLWEDLETHRLFEAIGSQSSSGIYDGEGVIIQEKN